jgi:ATP-dependent RNA helicase RhlB
MNMPERFSVTPEQVTVELIKQELYHVGKSEKFGVLLGILRREPDGRYLIFCNTRAAVDRLERLLNANDLATAAITGDIDQKKRLRVLTRFKEGRLPILAATDVASRGLHIDGVTHVINFDLPQDVEDYVHRIGRTARAGSEGRAISLACEEYVHSLTDVENFIKKKIPVMPLTDEMIVTDYRRRSPHARIKGKAPKNIARGQKPRSGDSRKSGRKDALQQKANTFKKRESVARKRRRPETGQKRSS